MAKEPKRFGDVMPSTLDFHPEVEARETVESVSGKVVIYSDALLVEDFDTKYGTHDMLIVLGTFPGGGSFTMAISQTVLLKKFRKALEDGLFPLAGEIAKPDGERYFDIT